MAVAATMVLRHFGLSIFLGQVAIASGRPFFDTVASQGPAVLLAGVTLVAVVLLVGHDVLRIRSDDLLGAGATGNPAILAGANRMLGNGRPDVGYAIVFPTMTIAKIIAVQLMLG